MMKGGDVNEKNTKRKGGKIPKMKEEQREAYSR